MNKIGPFHQLHIEITIPGIHIMDNNEKKE
jgi:hypothetical protein